MAVTIDAEELRKDIEESAKDKIKNMTLDQLHAVKKALCDLNEGETDRVKKVCFREAIAWMNEQIVSKLIGEV